jgi:hypothetical protein
VAVAVVRVLLSRCTPRLSLSNAFGTLKDIVTLLLCCCCSCGCCGSVCLLCAFAVVAEQSSLSLCGRRCRSRAALSLYSSAVVVESFRSFGGFSHFAPVLLLFLWMLWIGRRRTDVAVSVRPSLSSCGRRCRSRAALLLYSPWLSLSNGFRALKDKVTLLLCCCSSCGRYRSDCLCAFAFVAELSLSSCRRCRRAAVAVVRVVLLCSLTISGFGGFNHSLQGLLLLLLMLFF